MKTLAVTILMLWGTAAAAQTRPEVRVYVTDAFNDVFVAIYDGKAVQLDGCTLVSDGLRLLHLPEDTPVSETTQARLQAENALGAQPSLPCPGTAFDTVWPATTPIWADLEASGNYYLPAPSDTGFYAVPSACAEIKAALAIRERLQLPGVLQGFVAPPDTGPALVLDCGRQDRVDPGASALAGAAQWSLHTYQTFLSAESSGDTIYAARFVKAGDGAAPAYLPILRLDGKATRDIIQNGGAEAAEAATKLKTLLGIPTDDPVTQLGADAISGLLTAVHADLCLSGCDGYLWQAASFANPGVDLGVTPLGPGAETTVMDAFGNLRLDWTYLAGRSLFFTGCPALTAAMGLATAGNADWAGAVPAPAPAPGTSLDCRGTLVDTCVRRLNEGEALTILHFAGSADCAGKNSLRIELPATVSVPQALALVHVPFQTVRLVPAPGVGRARLVATQGPVPPGTSPCILSPIGALILAAGLPRLELERIDLLRASDDTGTGEVAGLLMQGGVVALDQVTVGTGGEGLSSLARGISLCQADLYAQSLQVEADMLALQGVASRILVSGQPGARSGLARARYGALLSASSLMRAEFTDFAADHPLVLRGAAATGQSNAFAPLQVGISAGSALQLERGSTASFTTSTIAGFRCAVSFGDAASAATLLLPGNAIATDNTASACGPGTFSLIE